MKKYRLFCQTDSQYECVVASTTPTKCPTNVGHTIDSDSISVVDMQDIIVNIGYQKEVTLADYKTLRYNEIDYKTGVLISAGFTYDGGLFSLSIAAQTNWNTLKDQEAQFTWPVEISTKDNNVYSLEQADLVAFWTAGKDAAKAHLDSGRALKKSIFDATDEAGVDAVEDNR